MTVYIMDSMYFDSVAKIIPAEFAKGSKMILFYEKGRELPGCVFEYISKGWISLKLLPAKMQDCIPVVTFEIGVQHTLHPEDKFILWGDAFLTGVFKYFLVYDDAASGYMGIRNILKDQSEVREKYPESSAEQKKPETPDSSPKPPKPENKSTAKKPRKGKKTEEKKPVVNPEARKASAEDLISDMMGMLDEADGAVLSDPAVPKSNGGAEKSGSTVTGPPQGKKEEKPGTGGQEASSHGKEKDKRGHEEDLEASSGSKENGTKDNREGEPGEKEENRSESKPQKKQLPGNTRTSANNVKDSPVSAGGELEDVLEQFLRKECFDGFKVSDDEMRCIVLSLLISADASSVKSGMHLYKDQLGLFLSENRAKVLYDKTVPVFESVVAYFGTDAKQ